MVLSRVSLNSYLSHLQSKLNMLNQASTSPQIWVRLMHLCPQLLTKISTIIRVVIVEIQVIVMIRVPLFSVIEWWENLNLILANMRKSRKYALLRGRFWFTVRRVKTYTILMRTLNINWYQRKEKWRAFNI